jgi:translation initiation factor 1 (eIF-1/SUI1)
MESSLLNQFDDVSNIFNERISISSQQQGRRKITIISGLDGRINTKTGLPLNLNDLCVKLKKSFCVGGTVKKNPIDFKFILQLQGDIKVDIFRYLIDKLKIEEQEIIIVGA